MIESIVNLSAQAASGKERRGAQECGLLGVVVTWCAMVSLTCCSESNESLPAQPRIVGAVVGNTLQLKEPLQQRDAVL